MEPSPRFWNRIAKSYAKRPIADEASYQRKLETTRRFLQPDTRVLEFGCGTGSTAIHHAPHAAHVHAIDISPKMLDIARARAEAAGVDNLTFERASIDHFQADDASYDVVLGLSILHLVADRDAIIRKVHDLLAPGGVFITSTACIGDRLKLLRLIAPLAHTLGLVPLLRFFSVDELIESLTAAGFTIEEHWQPRPDDAVFIVAKKPA